MGIFQRLVLLLFPATPWVGGGDSCRSSEGPTRPRDVEVPVDAETEGSTTLPPTRLRHLRSSPTPTPRVHSGGGSFLDHDGPSYVPVLVQGAGLSFVDGS